MIAIKPHHFVDIVTSVGDGCTKFEPHPYGHAVHTVSETILENPDTTLRMELGADDVCLPCCHNIDGCCDDTIDISFRPKAPKSKREYNLLIDERWCERLGLQQGDELTAREFCRLLKDRTDNLEEIYRENPPDRVADRQAKLRQGIAWFLQ